MFEIYYPAATTADNVPVIKDGKRFALVVFGHGYQLTYSDYLWLKDSLVPKGFFLVFPRTEEKLFPSHTDFAKDFSFIINKFDATKSQPGNWYSTRIKDQYAVGGHSMGGGCSLLSIQYSSKIKAVFNFAAAETNPSAISACSAIKIPALIYAGGKDCIAPPSSNQLPMYNNIQNVCKTFVQITIAKHCQWANNSSLCRAGELFCSPLSASPKATLNTTFSLLLPWLNEFLNLNKPEGQRFQTLLTNTSGITYQQNCSLKNGFAESITDNKTEDLLKAYPTLLHAGSIVNVAIPKLQNESLLKVSGQSGEIVFTRNLNLSDTGLLQINSAGFKPGIYFVVLVDGTIKYKTSFMIE